MGIVPVEIIHMLSDRRSRNEVLRERRVVALYEQYPELKEIDEQVRYCMLKRMLSLLENREEAELIHRLNALEKEKSALLRKLRIEANYDQVIPTCALCDDEGYIGKKMCACMRTLLLPFYTEQSGISGYPGVSFEHFSEDFYSDPEKIRSILRFSEAYVEIEIDQRPNLLFSGNAGTGKTFMAVSIARAVLARAESVVIIRSSDLIETLDEYRTLKRSFNPDPDRDASISAKRDHTLETDLLVIDELGVEAMGPHNTADLLFVFGERIQTNKATIVTTNLSLSELKDQYGDRLHSRLVGDFVMFPFQGKDIRTKSVYRNIPKGGKAP